jgi:UDP-N-acetylmuramoylalanine--D-glutamate ligase
MGGSWPAPARLMGRHNVENALAAAACARALGAPVRSIAEAFRSFRGVEHRLQIVRAWRGVRFINDSKATNVDSTRVALEALPGPLRLILGGEHKGSPYTPLRPLLRRKVKEVLLIGEAASVIERDLAGAVPLFHCRTLAKAVERAARTAVPGEDVLLSPACASFDQFDNFEQRGRAFMGLVQAL